MNAACKQTLQARLLSLLILGLVLALWHLATLPKGGVEPAASSLSAEQIEYQKLLGKDPTQAKKSDGFPTLAQMGGAVLKNLARPFYDNGPNDKGIGIQFAHSLGRVALGFGLAALLAIPLGFVIGMSSMLYRALDPFIQVLKRSKWPDWSSQQVDAQVEKYVHLVGLGSAIDKKPSALSGGMKQRVGIARAFAIEPKMLLLDEPFGALDALTRGTIQDELLRICAETKQTVFMITHDVDESILLADKILLMTNKLERAPPARVAEIVRNTMPRDRQRASLHHDPQYYRIRNHLVDFLVSRSKHLSHGKAPATPPMVEPGLVNGEPEPQRPSATVHRLADKPGPKPINPNAQEHA